jgi:hypothetical protein
MRIHIKDVAAPSSTANIYHQVNLYHEELLFENGSGGGNVEINAREVRSHHRLIDFNFKTTLIYQISSQTSSHCNSRVLTVLSR